MSLIPDLLTGLYREAQALPDVPDPDCGRTPTEHFVVQPDGSVRLLGKCLHPGPPITADRITARATVTADRIYVGGTVTADRLHALPGDTPTPRR